MNGNWPICGSSVMSGSVIPGSVTGSGAALADGMRELRNRSADRSGRSGNFKEGIAEDI